MNAVYGLFSSPDAAQHAFNGLKEIAIPEGDIVVLSSEPFEGYGFMRSHHRTAMPWIAVLGAFSGMGAGYLLTSLTQQAWPIETGGMPIVTNWTNLIVIFELTMLGAVLSTVATFFVTSGLPSRLPRLYDPAIADGKILVGVANAPETKLPEIERVLGTHGSIRRD
jgi:hypothetical protein